MSPSSPSTVMGRGVRIIGTGSQVPDQRITNADLEKIMDTSDEWIVQRTGIHERRKCDPDKGESAVSLSSEALEKAIVDAGIKPTDLDLIILGTVTGEMSCPSTACRVAANVGAGTVGALDLAAACCGFVYGLNIAHDLVRAGSFTTIAVIGCDVMTEVMDYGDRGVSILFGDAAGAAIIQASPSPAQGILAGSLKADGSGWQDLYLPRHARDIPAEVDPSTVNLGSLHMNGREVYKFAVKTFGRLIDSTLSSAGVSADDVDMYVCHQSNARIIESARERLGIPKEKMYVNIDKYGNCSGGSVPLCLDELRRAGQCREGDKVMFAAFGGGLTWAASLWQL